MSQDDIHETPSSTPDFRTELAQQLAELVPEAIADGKVDVTKLQELLDGDAAEGNERFGLFWPGKRRALRVAQEPTTATLKPDFENSKDWDTTQNVFIEGDNLEVLKILQRHYHGKIKMIFIDPPYNTGSDFVYNDDFVGGVKHYLDWSNQVNAEGQKLSSNVESGGRYHSNWLNMMYPRLKLARNLLREDGVLFASIDEHEVAQLRRLLDEIFGEANFVTDLIWQSRTSISDDLEVSLNHNHVLVYSRSRSKIRFWGEPLRDSEYKNPDNDPRGPWKLVPLDANKPGGDTLYPVLNSATGQEYWPPEGRSWAINSSSMRELMEDRRVMFGIRGDSAPKKKLFLNERLARGDSRTPSSLLLDAGTTKDGSEEIASLFGKKKVFDYPKPVSLLERLIRYGASGEKDAIVLDFFAGSGTTAHAVLKSNASDNAQRRFIVVQLPEPLPAGRLDGADTISDASRLRIALAGDKIQENNGLLQSNDDFGFRAFKLTDTNFSKWRSNSDVDAHELGQQLLNLADSADDEATPDDLLTEILLKQGFSLTERIKPRHIAGLDIRAVLQSDGDPAVLAYLDEHVKPSLDQLCSMVAEIPGGKIIVLEDAFQGDDELKTNLAQMCKTNNIELWTA